MGKSPGKSSSTKIINYDKQEVAPGSKMWELLTQGTTWNSSFFSALIISYCQTQKTVNGWKIFEMLIV